MARHFVAKECFFCKKKIADIDYKDANLLQRYISGWGKIKRTRETGTCAKHQRALATAIKRARFMAFLPYTTR